MTKSNESKFLVYTVESPSPVDIYHDRKETELIEAATRLNDAPFVSKTAVDLTAFEAALILGLEDAIDLSKDRFPILHLSMHGDGEGIALTSKDVYAFVPDVPLTCEWTDEKLYKRYALTKDEVAFIESMVRPMPACAENLDREARDE